MGALFLVVEIFSDLPTAGISCAIIIILARLYWLSLHSPRKMLYQKVLALLSGALFALLFWFFIYILGKYA